MNRYQTLGKRILALIADLFVIAVPLLTIDSAVMALKPPVFVLLPWLLVSNFAGAVYHILMHGRYGQTVGKMLVRVKVVRQDDEGPIDLYQAYLRELPTLIFNTLAFLGQASVVLSNGTLDRTAPTAVDNAIMFLAFPWVVAEILSALSTEKRRAVHDLIAGTTVIKLEAAEPAAEGRE